MISIPLWGGFVRRSTSLCIEYLVQHIVLDCKLWKPLFFFFWDRHVSFFIVFCLSSQHSLAGLPQNHCQNASGWGLCSLWGFARVRIIGCVRRAPRDGDRYRTSSIHDYLSGAVTVGGQSSPLDMVICCPWGGCYFLHLSQAQ